MHAAHMVDMSSSVKRDNSSQPRRWSVDEDERLRKAVSSIGEVNWKGIADVVGTRTNVQCLQRWKKVLCPGLVKGQWRNGEDEKLVKLVAQGYKNWGHLASRMPGRTSKQCRERWCHHLDPSIKKGSWTEEEDRVVIETQREVGNKWSLIAQKLPGRTENAIKIRFKAMQRTQRRGNGEAAQLISEPPTHPPQIDPVLRAMSIRACYMSLTRARDNDGIPTVGQPQDPETLEQIVREELMEGVGELDMSDLEPPPASPFPVVERAGSATSSARSSPLLEGPAGAGIPYAITSGAGTTAILDKTWPQRSNQLSMGQQPSQRAVKAEPSQLWTPEEDQKLTLLVSLGEFSNWTALSKHMPGRSNAECRERWVNILDPESSSELRRHYLAVAPKDNVFLDREDHMILEIYRRWGRSPQHFAQYLPNRSIEDIEERYQEIVAPIGRRGCEAPVASTREPPILSEARPSSSPSLLIPRPAVSSGVRAALMVANISEVLSGDGSHLSSEEATSSAGPPTGSPEATLVTPDDMGFNEWDGPIAGLPDNLVDMDALYVAILGDNAGGEEVQHAQELKVGGTGTSSATAMETSPLSATPQIMSLGEQPPRRHNSFLDIAKAAIQSQDEFGGTYACYGNGDHVNAAIPKSQSAPAAVGSVATYGRTEGKQPTAAQQKEMSQDQQAEAEGATSESYDYWGSPAGGMIEFDPMVDVGEGNVEDAFLAFDPFWFDEGPPSIGSQSGSRNETKLESEESTPALDQALPPSSLSETFPMYSGSASAHNTFTRLDTLKVDGGSSVPLPADVW